MRSPAASAAYPFFSIRSPTALTCRSCDGESAAASAGLPRTRRALASSEMDSSSL